MFFLCLYSINIQQIQQWRFLNIYTIYYINMNILLYSFNTFHQIQTAEHKIGIKIRFAGYDTIESYLSLSFLSLSLSHKHLSTFFFHKHYAAIDYFHKHYAAIDHFHKHYAAIDQLKALSLILCCDYLINFSFKVNSQYSIHWLIGLVIGWVVDRFIYPLFRQL